MLCLTQAPYSVWLNFHVNLTIVFFGEQGIEMSAILDPSGKPTDQYSETVTASPSNASISQRSHTVVTCQFRFQSSTASAVKMKMAAMPHGKTPLSFILRPVKLESGEYKRKICGVHRAPRDIRTVYR